jgi:hypothetical protein
MLSLVSADSCFKLIPRRSRAARSTGPKLSRSSLMSADEASSFPTGNGQKIDWSCAVVSEIAHAWNAKLQ